MKRGKKEEEDEEEEEEEEEREAGENTAIKVWRYSSGIMYDHRVLTLGHMTWTFTPELL